MSSAPRTRSLSAAVVDRPGADVAAGRPQSAEARWRPSGLDNIGLTGAALIIISFAFDGHTVSRGPRVLHALTSVVHVAGAAAWAGGLVALAVVLWRRHHDGVSVHHCRLPRGAQWTGKITTKGKYENHNEDFVLEDNWMDTESGAKCLDHPIQRNRVMGICYAGRSS